MTEGEIMKQLEERITYVVVCEQMPEPMLVFTTYEQAVAYAKREQPLYRPYYIFERVECFTLCGVVGEEKE